MKGFIKTLVAASMTLAMGCSRDWMDWPLSPTEDGKVVIEGGGGEEPDWQEAFPATVYGTIHWWRTDIMGSNGYIYVYDANRNCICSRYWGFVIHDPQPFDVCGCDLRTDRPLPWYVCGEAYDGNLDMYWHDEDTITDLSGRYNCPGFRKKAPSTGIDLYLGDPGPCPECEQ